MTRLSGKRLAERRKREVWRKKKKEKNQSLLNQCCVTNKNDPLLICQNYIYFFPGSCSRFDVKHLRKILKKMAVLPREAFLLDCNQNSKHTSLQIRTVHPCQNHPHVSRTPDETSADLQGKNVHGEPLCRSLADEALNRGAFVPLHGAGMRYVMPRIWSYELRS